MGTPPGADPNVLPSIWQKFTSALQCVVQCLQGQTQESVDEEVNDLPTDGVTGSCENHSSQASPNGQGARVSEHEQAGRAASPLPLAPPTPSRPSAARGPQLTARRTVSQKIPSNVNPPTQGSPRGVTLSKVRLTARGPKLRVHPRLLPAYPRPTPLHTHTKARRGVRAYRESGSQALLLNLMQAPDSAGFFETAAKYVLRGAHGKAAGHTTHTALIRHTNTRTLARVYNPKGLAGALVEVGALQAMAQCSLCPTLLDTAIVHNVCALVVVEDMGRMHLAHAIHYGMVRGTGALDALAVSLTSFLKVAKNRHVAFPSLALHTIAVTMTGNMPSFKVTAPGRVLCGDSVGLEEWGSDMDYLCPEMFKQDADVWALLIYRAGVLLVKALLTMGREAGHLGLSTSEAVGPFGDSWDVDEDGMLRLLSPPTLTLAKRGRGGVAYRRSWERDLARVQACVPKVYGQMDGKGALPNLLEQWLSPDPARRLASLEGEEEEGRSRCDSPALNESGGRRAEVGQGEEGEEDGRGERVPSAASETSTHEQKGQGPSFGEGPSFGGRAHAREVGRGEGSGSHVLSLGSEGGEAVASFNYNDEEEEEGGDTKGRAVQALSTASVLSQASMGSQASIRSQASIVSQADEEEEEEASIVSQASILSQASIGSQADEEEEDIGGLLSQVSSTEGAVMPTELQTGEGMGQGRAVDTAPSTPVAPLEAEAVTSAEAEAGLPVSHVVEAVEATVPVLPVLEAEAGLPVTSAEAAASALSVSAVEEAMPAVPVTSVHAPTAALSVSPVLEAAEAALPSTDAASVLPLEAPLPTRVAFVPYDAASFEERNNFNNTTISTTALRSPIHPFSGMGGLAFGGGAFAGPLDVPPRQAWVQGSVGLEGLEGVGGMLRRPRGHALTPPRDVRQGAWALSGGADMRAHRVSSSTPRQMSFGLRFGYGGMGGEEGQGQVRPPTPGFLNEALMGGGGGYMGGAWGMGAHAAPVDTEGFLGRIGDDGGMENDPFIQAFMQGGGGGTVAQAGGFLDGPAMGHAMGALDQPWRLLGADANANSSLLYDLWGGGAGLDMAVSAEREEEGPGCMGAGFWDEACVGPLIDARQMSVFQGLQGAGSGILPAGSDGGHSQASERAYMGGLGMGLASQGGSINSQASISTADSIASSGIGMRAVGGMGLLSQGSVSGSSPIMSFGEGSALAIGGGSLSVGPQGGGVSMGGGGGLGGSSINQPVETLDAWITARYVLTGLGQGGYGRVVIARSKDTPHTRHIVKFVASKTAATLRLVRNELSINQLLAGLEGGDCCVTFSDGQVIKGGDSVFVMRYRPDGIDLTKFQHTSPLFFNSVQTSAERLRACHRQLGSAIKFLASHCILHRDIKACNALMCMGEGPDGFTVRLLDFGLSQTGAFLKPMEAQGTPGYIAPEMALCHAGVQSVASDLWSLGQLMVFLLPATLGLRENVAFLPLMELVRNYPYYTAAMQAQHRSELEGRFATYIDSVETLLTQRNQVYGAPAWVCDELASAILSELHMDPAQRLRVLESF